MRDLNGEGEFAEAGDRLESLSVSGWPERTGNCFTSVEISGKEYAHLHRGWRRGLQRLRVQGFAGLPGAAGGGL